MTEPTVDQVIWGWGPYTVDNDANTIDLWVLGYDEASNTVRRVPTTLDTTGYEVYVQEFQPLEQDREGYVYNSALVKPDPTIQVVLHVG